MSILPSASDTRITGSIFNITGTSQAPPQALAPTEQVSHDFHCEMKLTESLIASKDYTFQATPANPYLCRTSLNRRSRSSALAPRAQPRSSTRISSARCIHRGRWHHPAFRSI